MIADLETIAEIVRTLATEARQQQAANIGLSESNVEKDDEIRVIQAKYEVTLRRLNTLMSQGHKESYDQGLRHGHLAAEADYADEIEQLKREVEHLKAQLADRGLLEWSAEVGATVYEDVA